MIYLLRHGQTQWNAKNLLQGHTDIPLNTNGVKQALKVAREIESVKIDYIFSSDLSRAKETAEIINTQANLSVKITIDERLRETYLGKLEKRFIKDITQEEWRKFDESPELYNAETWEQRYQRVNSFWKEIKNMQNVLIVTHAGTIALLRYCSKYHNFNLPLIKQVYNKELTAHHCTLTKLI